MSESYWWCANCTEEVDGSHVTYGEMHDNCGHPVESITPEKQERIAELEREKQMYINSTDRLTARVKELEAELAYRYRRHAADVEKRDRKIAELRKDIKRLETNNSNLER